VTAIFTGHEVTGRLYKYQFLCITSLTTLPYFTCFTGWRVF